MTVTAPTPLTTLVAGQIATATDLNAMASVVNFLSDKPVIRVHASTGGRAISTSGSAITWDASAFDNSGMYNSADPTYLTVQVPGWYKVRYTIAASNTSGVLNGYGSVLSGGVTSPERLPSFGVAVSSVPQLIIGASGLWPWYLNEGDQITIYGMANASGAVTSVTVTQSELSMEYVSQ